METGAIVWPGWEVAGLLGRGNQGSVYELRRQGPAGPERAALKVISIPQDPQETVQLSRQGWAPQDIARLYKQRLDEQLRQLDLLRQMAEHPHVVACRDLRYAPHADGLGWNIYMQMDLLQPLFRHYPAEPTQIAQMGIQLCDALSAYRAKGLLHPDLKPQNVLIAPDGSYQLADFGGIGNPAFVAPEICNGQAWHQTADVYSLGLLMYWLLNGRKLPFEAPSGDARMAHTRRIRGENLPDPMGGSDSLKQIVLLACAPDPNGRFAAPEAMTAALKHVLQPAPAPVPMQNSLAQPAPAPVPMQNSLAQPAPAPVPMQNSLAQPTPEPAPAPVPMQNSLAQPTPKPAPAPVPMQNSLAQPTPEPAPAPVPMQNSLAQPAPAPAQEPVHTQSSLAQPAPEPAQPEPMPEPEPAQPEPMPAPVLPEEPILPESTLPAKKPGASEKPVHGPKAEPPAKKKSKLLLILSIVAGVAVLAVVAFFFLHIWNDPTCGEIKTCVICGKTEGKALAHSWKEASCSAPRTCSVCGQQEGEALPHDLEPATGTRGALCKVCGAEIGEPLNTRLWYIRLTSGGSGLQGSGTHSCTDQEATLAFPDDPTFRDSVITVTNAQGVPVSADSFQYTWEGSVVHITPSPELAVGVYGINFQLSSGGGALLMLGYGYEDAYYQGEADYFWYGAYWKSSSCGKYLTVQGNTVTVSDGISDATCFDSSTNMLGVEVNAAGDTAKPTAGPWVEMETMSYYAYGSAGCLNVFRYADWYLACDSQGQLYMTKELGPDCFWTEHK